MSDPEGVVVLSPDSQGVYTHPRFGGFKYPMTDEERRAKIAALAEERRGYLARGLSERAAEVDAQISTLADEAEPRKSAKRG